MNGAPGHPGGGTHGFTLVEVLLAAVLTAVLAAAVFGTLAAGRDASRRGEVSGEIDQIARQALERISADLLLARRPSRNFDTGFVGTGGGTEADASDAIDFVTASPLPDPARLGPVDVSDAARPRRIDLARVLYAIDEDPETPERGLVRREQRLLTAATTDQEDSLDTLEIAPEIVGLRFRYLLGAEWVTAWDSRQSESIPQAVEAAVTARFERYQEVHERTLRTIVRCALAPPIGMEETR